MSQTAMQLNTLTRELKAQGITYADVAARLDLSESSIKRLFRGRSSPWIGSNS